MLRRVLIAAVLLVRFAAGADAQKPKAVVASEHRLATQAGVHILERGGNFVDAAVATALAGCVVNPSSCGIGGGGFMLIFERRTQTVAALDFRETAPAAASRDMFLREGKADPQASLYGGLAVATPGEVAGLTAALDRFGSLSFAEVSAPAVGYARDGFPIEAHLARAIGRQREEIRRRPDLAALLLRPDGNPLQVGDVLRRPDLARTLEEIAAHGPAAFYHGRVADEIVSAVRAAGGILSHADLAAYRPVWRRPVHGRFHGYEVYGMPPPSAGGGVLVTALNILAGDDLAALGHNTPTYAHLLAEAMQFGFADRASAYGDPDFVDVPLPRLLSPERATHLRHRLSAATTFSPAYYGTHITGSDGGTAHLSVIDAFGNAVACTTSINTAFGSHVVGGGSGVILNNTMDDFSAAPGAPNVFGLVGSEANQVAPGKRPTSSMTPTIVTRGGAAAIAVGGSGGPFIISGTLQTLLNLLVFEQDAATALAAPRLHHQWVPPAVLIEPAMPAMTRDALGRLGHETVEFPSVGAVQAVVRSANGTLDGAADPRKGGTSTAW